MAEIATRIGTEVAVFDPGRTKEAVSVYEAAIAHASRIKDWESLTRAIEEKVKEQKSFVAWWRGNVRERGKNANVSEGGLFVEQAQDATGVSKQTVSRWAARLKDEGKYKQALFDKPYKAAFGSMAAANTASETNEWYTPPQYIESVRELFGGTIDLDPASCAKANKVVKAAKYFSQGGETKDWFGNVFLNPPYGIDNGESRAGKFCRKAIAEYEAGRITACIILVNSVHAQSWQKPIYDFPVCFVDHRIQFMDADGEVNPNPTFMNVFVYLGPDKAGFARVFSTHGYCMERIQWAL